MSVVSIVGLQFPDGDKFVLSGDGQFKIALNALFA